MISRTTPSKRFRHSQNTSNCCSCLTESHIEKKVSFNLKSPSNKLKKPVYSNTTSTAWNKEQVYQAIIYQTPRSHLSTSRKINLEVKQLASTTINKKIERKSKEIPVTLHSTEIVQNPLKRLNIRSRRQSILVHKIENESKIPVKIVFNYSIPKISNKSSQQYLNLDLSLRKPQENDTNQEKELMLQIDKYKREYKILLEQYNELKLQKQTNIQIYRELLEKLRRQENQVRELQRFRRQQIQQLREQLQKVITSKRKEKL